MEFYKYLKIGFFNINSLIGETTSDPDFKSLIEKYDIISLSETWHQNSDCIKKIKENFPPNFRFIDNARKKKKKNKCKRNSGGILVCYKQVLHKHITIIDRKTENMIWIKIHKDFLNQKQNLFVGGIYISPINSSYTKNTDEDTFLKIQEKLLTLNQNDFIVLGGDFNARTGNEQDIIDETDDEVELLNLPQNYKISTIKKYRCNKDQHKNSYGDKLIDLATSANLKILNGRTLGDLEGRYTYIGYNGLSTVDYVLASENMFSRNIHSFVVEEMTNFSDHRPTSLTVQYNGSKPVTETEEHTTNRPRNLNKACDFEIYKNELNNRMQDHLIEPLIRRIENLEILENDTTEIDEVIRVVNNIYVSDDSITTKTFRKNQQKNARTKNKPWFTDDCGHMKKRLNLARKMLEKKPDKQDLRILFYNTRKKYNKLVKQQRRKYERNLTQKLEYLYSNDRMEFWKHLKSMKTQTNNETLPNLSTLIAHFEDLYFKEEQNENLNAGSETDTQSVTNAIFNPLNAPITEEEVSKIKNSLKTQKAAAYDLITNKMIKATNEIGVKLLTKLFNTLLTHKYFPKDWNYGILRLIHKGDDPEDANNYRAITLNSCLGKLFCTILNARFSDILEKNNIICKEQAGFRKNSRTTDWIFLLKHIVRTYVSKNQFLYTCFVDFSKAFDSIWRKALIEKLIKIGIHGKFLDIIKSMYNFTTNSIIYGDKLSKRFRSNIGVKQGDTLSTTLFNLYINDLPDEFDFDDNNPIRIGSTDISCLLYADDLIIMSTSPESLQKCISKLEQYCIKWKLQVNLKKTKIMIFNKQGSLIKKYKFYFNNNIIENVREYKYLGFTFTCSGLDIKGKCNLLKQAKKAWYAIKHYLQKSENRCFSTYTHIFDSQVKPIMLYACEVWADSLKENKTITENIQSNPIEKFQINVLKQLLGVHKKTSNIAVLLETGRHPVTLTAKIQAIKYFLRFSSIEHTRLLHTYYESQKRELNGPYMKFILNTLEKIGLGNIWHSQLHENPKNTKSQSTITRQISQRLRDISSQNILSNLASNGKLKFLQSLKTEHKIEPYLKIHNFEHRRAITKIRTSSHRLKIETGRWDKVDREDRICENCLLNKIEDESHLLFECHMHIQERLLLHQKIKNLGKTDMNTKNMTLTKEIFLTDDLPSLNAVGKYIMNSLNKRENTTLLTSPPNFSIYLSS